MSLSPTFFLQTIKVKLFIFPAPLIRCKDALLIRRSGCEFPSTLSSVGRLMGDSKLEAKDTGHRAAGQLTKACADALDNVSAFFKEKPVS